MYCGILKNHNFIEVTQLREDSVEGLEMCQKPKLFTL